MQEVVDLKTPKLDAVMLANNQKTKTERSKMRQAKPNALNRLLFWPFVNVFKRQHVSMDWFCLSKLREFRVMRRFWNHFNFFQSGLLIVIYSAANFFSNPRRPLEPAIFSFIPESSCKAFLSKELLPNPIVHVIYIPYIIIHITYILYTICVFYTISST